MTGGKTNMKQEIKIYKKFTEYDNSLYLKPQELYLYCYLNTLKNIQNKVITSVDLIHQIIPLRYHNSREEINRKLIADHLLLLKDKDIISFNLGYKDILGDRSGKYAAIEVTFNEVVSDDYYQLKFDEYNNFKNINHFYIYASIRGYDYYIDSEGLYGRQISIKEFARLLCVNDRTLSYYIDNMIEQGLLYKLVKKESIDSNQKDRNRYRTIPYPDGMRSDTLNTLKSNRTINVRKENSGYENWRTNVFENDNYTCQVCHKTNKMNVDIILHAHHKDGYDWCIERRTDPTNGATLCDSCHTEFHVLYGYGRNTEQQYIEFYEDKVRTKGGVYSD